MNRKKVISFGKISKDFGKSTQTSETSSEETVSEGGFTKFGKQSFQSQAIEDLPDDTESKDLQDLMGISGFGKKAKSFDVQVCYF